VAILNLGSSSSAACNRRSAGPAAPNVPSYGLSRSPRSGGTTLTYRQIHGLLNAVGRIPVAKPPAFTPSRGHGPSLSPTVGQLLKLFAAEDLEGAGIELDAAAPPAASVPAPPSGRYCRPSPPTRRARLGGRGRLGREGAVLDLHPPDRDGRSPVGASWGGGDASTTVHPPGCPLEPTGLPPHNAISTSVSRDDPEGGA
jgi:hypothetical protein